MQRDDLSNKLIHFTKGTDQEAADIFLKIINESRLLGGKGFIRGGYPCVCFTESPVSKLAYMLANRHLLNVNYAPFGVMVDKIWLWGKGGRPVIYQSENEYIMLHEEQKYRHKRYEPDKGIDFSWEREWRIKTEELILDHSDTTIIVPTRHWADWLHDKHTENIFHAVSVLDDCGYQYIEKFPWHIIALEDLGISF